MNPNEIPEIPPDYNGINFCPRCGFDCRTVGIAMQFSAQKAITSPVAPVKQEQTFTPPHQETRLDKELLREILERRAAGQGASRIAREMNITVNRVNYVIYQKFGGIQKGKVPRGLKRRDQAKNEPSNQTETTAA